MRTHLLQNSPLQVMIWLLQQAPTMNVSVRKQGSPKI